MACIRRIRGVSQPLPSGKLMSYALEPMMRSGEDLTQQLLISLQQHGFRNDLQTYWDIANHVKVSGAGSLKTFIL